MDRLATMRTFVRVVEAGSFAAAAERLEISSGLASRHVMDLEEHLGTRLLNRTTRRISLTPAGAAYYDRCRRLLADLQDIELSVASENSEPRGILRVNAPTVFGARHLPRLIRDYEAMFGNISIDLTLDDRFVDPVEEGADVLLRIGTLHDSSLVARRLCPIRLVTCASPDYLARHGTPRTPEDLATHNCLEYSYARAGAEWTLGSGATKTSVAVHGTLRSNNGEALCRAAIEGLGIVLQPTFICGEAISNGQLVPILCGFEPPPLHAYAVYLSRRFVSAKVRSFVAFLADRLGPEPFWDAWFASAHAARSAPAASAPLLPLVAPARNGAGDAVDEAAAADKARGPGTRPAGKKRSIGTPVTGRNTPGAKQPRAGHQVPTETTTAARTHAAAASGAVARKKSGARNSAAKPPAVGKPPRGR